MAGFEQVTEFLCLSVTPIGFECDPYWLRNQFYSIRQQKNEPAPGQSALLFDPSVWYPISSCYSNRAAHPRLPHHSTCTTLQPHLDGLLQRWRNVLTRIRPD